MWPAWARKSAGGNLSPSHRSLLKWLDFAKRGPPYKASDTPVCVSMTHDLSIGYFLLFPCVITLQSWQHLFIIGQPAAYPYLSLLLNIDFFLFLPCIPFKLRKQPIITFSLALWSDFILFCLFVLPKAPKKTDKRIQITVKGIRIQLHHSEDESLQS